MSEKLPHNDPDLQLSLELKDWIAEEKYLTIEDSDTRLKKTLAEYNRLYRRRKSFVILEPEESISIKKAILKNAGLPRTPQFNITNSWKYAAAAVICLFAFLSLFLWMYPTDKKDIFASTSNEIITKTLPDQSEVTLRPNSTLYRLAERSYQIEGEGYFKVKTDERKLFTVQANNLNVTVTGTEFNLSSWGKKPGVYLVEGSVEVYTIELNHKIKLEPGEAALIGPDGTLITEKTDGSTYLDWQNGLLTFDHTPLSAIFEELEQHYGIQIETGGNIPDSLTLSGSLSLDELSATLSDLEKVSDGRFTPQNERTFKYHFE